MLDTTEMIAGLRRFGQSEVADEMERLLNEVLRLKLGQFTEQEIHDICHNFPATVSPRQFADGCSAEQRRLYGCAPDADEVARLRALK